MPIRKSKPTSPGRRFQSHSDYAELTRAEPEKSLLEPNPKKAGRNNYGRITTRHQGGGQQGPLQGRSISGATRTVFRPKSLTSSTTPTATHAIALLHYKDGEKRYILMPNRVKVGDILQSGPGADIRPGNALPLRNIPVGTVVHNVELKPGAGGKMARSAGSSVQLVAKEGAQATLRLPSGEMRMVRMDCRATVGEVGNAESELISIGKAGRNRWKTSVRRCAASSMNPVDHPLGGGEGKSSGGRHPVSPWGKKEGRTRQ